MSDTKAISPAVKGLFDKVRKQADEYTKAFDDLQSEMEEIQRERNSLDKTKQALINDVNSSITAMNDKLGEALDVLENKTAITLKNFKDHDKIVSLRESLSDLNNVLSSQKSEMQTLITNFKTKSGLELESTFINIKANVDKKIASELKKIELQLARKMSILDNKLSNAEEQVKNILNQKSSETHRLLSDMKEINNKFETFQQSNDELVRVMFERLELYKEEIDDTTGRLKMNVSQLEDKFSDMIYGSAALTEGGEKLGNEYGGLSMINNKLPFIEENLRAVKMQMTVYQRLLWTTILLSTIAIVGLVFLFVIM